MISKTYQESESNGKFTTTMNKGFAGKTVSVEALKSEFPFCFLQNPAMVKRHLCCHSVYDNRNVSLV